MKTTTHGYNGGIYTTTVQYPEGIFMVPSALSAARIAAIARAVLADAPTGAKGEALTLTRSTPQFCESSDGTGSLVPANRLCVTRGGTTAAQRAFTQYAVRTEEFNDATWNGFASSLPPTITANYDVSPGGTLTAERAIFSATTAVQSSYRLMLGGCGGSNPTASFWVRSLDDGYYDIEQCVYDSGAATYVCDTVPVTPTWNRVSTEFTTAGATSHWLIGHAGVAPVGGSGNAFDEHAVAIWGTNCTAGTSLRPYIPATNIAVTTGAELPYLALSNAPALNSVEVTVDTPAALVSVATFAVIYKDTNNRSVAYRDGAKLGCLYVVGGVSYTGLSAADIPLGTTGVRFSCSYDGTSVIACVNGSCNSTAQSFTNFSGATRAYVGANSVGGGYEANPNYVIKGVKADPNSARFR